MVSLKAIKAANADLRRSNITAVFVGATSGIGLGGIEALLTSTTSPRTYIIGRSESKFAATLDHLRTLNASAEITFIEAQVSLLKEVSRICSIIKDKEKAIDILWLSQGSLMPPTHSLNSEGLTGGFAINFYSRMLFMHLLAPLLEQASDPRVLSILSPGNESTIKTSDPGLQDPSNYGLFAANKQGVTMMSLCMHQLALALPSISFLHTAPGIVATNVHARLTESIPSPFKILGHLLEWLMGALAPLVGYTPAEAGHAGLFECTDARYSASSGRNFWRLWNDAEPLKPKSVLTEYMEDGTSARMWEHTQKVFENVLES